MRKLFNFITFPQRTNVGPVFISPFIPFLITEKAASFWHETLLSALLYHASLMCLSGQDKVPSVHPQPQCLGDPIVSHIVSVFLSAGGSYEERVHPQGGPSINNTGLNVIIQSVKQMKLPPPDKFKLTGSLILNKSLLSGQLHLKQPIDSILHKQIFTNAVGLFKCFDFIDG